MRNLQKVVSQKKDHAHPGMIFLFFIKKHMISSKRDEDRKREEQEKETAFENGQSPESVKKNPNPRANENLPEKDKKENDNKDTTGAGSEITDGEDG